MNTEVFELLTKLEDSGFKAFLVGGCVRDFLLGIEISDIDITTNARPDDILNVFKDYKTLDHGKKFGTISVKFGEKFYEITTFRGEGKYTDKRRPDTVYFLDTLNEDLARRDFTINAIAMDKFQNIYDPFNGRNDIRDRNIRAVGDANKRIKEDALRILRAIRFACKLNFYLDEDLFEAISLNRMLILKVSKERIFSEISKILVSERASYGFYLMEESGILLEILPLLQLTVGYDQKSPWHDRNLFDHLLDVMDNVKPDLSLRLAALFHDIAKPHTFSIDENGNGHYLGHEILGAEIAGDILKDFKAPKDLIVKVKILIKEHMKVHEFMTDKALRRQIKRVGRENILDLYDLMYADCISTRSDRDGSFILKRKKRVENLLNENEMKNDKFLNIDGYDLINLGYKGKIIGEALRYAEDLVMENPNNNKKDLLVTEIKNKFKIGDNYG